MRVFVVLLLLLLQKSTSEAVELSLEDGARSGVGFMVGDPKVEDGAMLLFRPVDQTDDGRNKYKVIREKQETVNDDNKIPKKEDKTVSASRGEGEASWESIKPQQQDVTDLIEKLKQSGDDVTGIQDVCGPDVTLDYGESMVLYTNDDTSRDICMTKIWVPEGAEIGFDCSTFDLNKKGCKREKLWLKGEEKRKTSIHCRTDAPEGVIFPSTHRIRVRYNRKKVQPGEETKGFICKVYTVGDPPSTTTTTTTTATTTTTTTITTTTATTTTTTTTTTTVTTAPSSCGCCMLAGVEYPEGYRLLQDDYCEDVRCINGAWQHFPSNGLNPNCLHLHAMASNYGIIISFDGTSTPFFDRDCTYSLVQKGSSETPSDYVYFNLKDDPNNPGGAPILDKLTFGDSGEAPVTCSIGDYDGCSFGAVEEPREVTAAGTLVVKWQNFGNTYFSLMGANKIMVHYVDSRRLYVRVPTSMQGQVAGLGGPYNGNPSDDRTTRQGVVTTDTAAFLNSWKVLTMCEGG